MVAMGLEMVLADAGCEVVGPVGRFDKAGGGGMRGRRYRAAALLAAIVAMSAEIPAKPRA